MKETIILKSEYDDCILIEKNNEVKVITYSQYQINYKHITLPINVFNSFIDELGLTIKHINKIHNNINNDMIFIQNIDKLKIIINTNKKEYMIKKFVSKNNEIDYIELNNDICDKIIRSLEINNYNEIEYNGGYYASSDIIYKNFEEFVENKEYQKYYMFERKNHFNYELIKKFFLKYLNYKIDKSIFNNFIELMSILLKYHPTKLSKKEKRIFDYLNFLFDEEFKRYHRSNVIIDLSNIKYLYNELNETYEEDTIVYYMFNHYNDYSEEIYEVVIFDYMDESYWMGFIPNPSFKSNILYVDTYVMNIIEGNIEFNANVEHICKKYETFKVINDYEDFDYLFDETLKEKCFKN